MVWKVPVVAQSYEWDAAKNQFPMKRLHDFLEQEFECMWAIYRAIARGTLRASKHIRHKRILRTEFERLVVRRANSRTAPSGLRNCQKHET
jgi:hypothetical protein